MSKVYDYYNEKSIFDEMPSMNEVEYELSIEKDLQKAEEILRKIESDSNPAYIKKLVDKYFKIKEGK